MTMRSSTSAFAFILIFGAALLGQSNPVPFVNQPLVPTTVTPGSPAFTLTVNGTGFVSDSTVNWNGSPRTTTFVGSSQLTATILATDVAVASTGTVTVSSPAPGGGVSNLAFLSVTNPFRQVTFLPSSFGNPAAAWSMITADLNADGKLDLVTSDESGKVSVFLGNGDGTFQAQTDYVVGSSGNDVVSVAAVDVNGDGKLDLVACNVENQEAAVLLGKGDGTFGTASYYSTGAESNSMVTGDFNGDGFIDLAVVNNGPNTIAVLLGNGDGTFKSPIATATGFGPFYATVGDFNGDGKLDLVVTLANEETIQMMLGNGDGTFQPPVSYTAGYNPYTLVAADFNGDGKLDVAVTNANDFAVNSVSVFLGNGDGTLKPLVAYNVGESPSIIATADLDGDGKLDLMVVNTPYDMPSLSVLYGNGDGTFQPEAIFSVTADWTVVPADFNNDGRLDLAMVDRYHDTVTLLTQIPSVNLSPVTLSFVNQIVGTASPSQAVVLTNASNAELQISSFSITGPSGSDFSQTNTCPATLNPGANCTVNVTYNPARVESDTATLTVQDSGAPSSQTVALSGNSIGPVVVLSSRSLTFANQVVGTASSPQSVTLTNTGTIPLAVGSIAASGNFSQTNTCGTSVAVGGACTIVVKFLPTLIGARSGTIVIQDNAGPPTQTIKLSGTGTDMSLSTLSLTFAPQKIGSTSPSSSVRLTNVGKTAVTFSAFSITGPNATNFAQSNNCGLDLAAGRSCSIAVTFTPSARGTRSASLTITDNGGGSPQIVTLTGTGD